MTTQTTTEPILTADEVEMIAATRILMKQLRKRSTDRAFSNYDEIGNFPPFSLGRFVGLIDAAEESLFDILNSAHNGHDTPVSDDQMYGRQPTQNAL